MAFPQVTQQVINAAENAYIDMGFQASAWLKSNPGGDVTAAITAFSRGDASAAIFSQMLYVRGLIDPANGQVLKSMGSDSIETLN